MKKKVEKIKEKIEVLRVPPRKFDHHRLEITKVPKRRFDHHRLEITKVHKRRFDHHRLKITKVPKKEEIRKLRVRRIRHYKGN